MLIRKINVNYLLIYGHLEAYEGMSLDDYSFRCVVKRIIKFTDIRQLLIVEWKENEKK